jgi:hypothetical protein
MRQSIHKATWEVAEEHNPDMGAWRVAGFAVVAFLSACGGGRDENADKPDCPTTTAAQPTSTTDPRCVQIATETSDETAGQHWKGTIGGTGVNIPEGPGCPNPATAYGGDFTMEVARAGNATLTGRLITTSCGKSIDTPFNRGFPVAARP